MGKGRCGARKMKLYHLSEQNLDGEILYPRIPCNKMTKSGNENATIPRICFSPSIKRCLMAINKNNLKNKKYYVHIVKTKEYCNVSRNLVPDAFITKEKWILHPVKLRCIGTIKVKGLRKIKKYYSYEWKYKWIDRANKLKLW